jgi:hypothetical protein
VPQVALVQKYLKVAKWVAWVDCDSFFMDDTKQFTDLIPNPARFPDVDLVLSEDGLTVNTGEVTCSLVQRNIVATLSFLVSLQACFSFATARTLASFWMFGTAIWTHRLCTIPTGSRLRWCAC